MLKMDLRYEKNILFINLEGTLNRGTSYKINNFLIPSILKHRIKYGILNIKSLREIDEDGIDSLLNIKSSFKNNKGLLLLHETNDEIIKSINKLHLKKVKSLDKMGV
ncbi:MAG: STAS domain-containing protein [Bacilli bacterium]|nr:STAS domain-containing protein [Bacilli bacterium]